MTDELTLAMRHPHGTRVRYVLGCRCQPCKDANTALYHARQKRIAEQRAEVKPSGPALAGTLTRAGIVYNVLRCPGANGKKCVRNGAWLRGAEVCAGCVERATVWNGNVSAVRARRHLLKLELAGVGRRTVADIARLAESEVHAIKMGRTRRIRAQTEKRILAVTKDVQTDATLVDARPTWKRIEWLLEQGFTRAEIARRLGFRSLQLQFKTPRIRAKSALRIERFYRSMQE